MPQQFSDRTQKHTPGSSNLKSDRLFADAANYAAHNRHMERTSVPSAGLDVDIDRRIC
jgi:hypothetical protein